MSSVSARCRALAPNQLGARNQEANPFEIRVYGLDIHLPYGNGTHIEGTIFSAVH